MIKLKHLLEICKPDWIVIENRKIIETRKAAIPEALLDFPVKNIEGFDDGLTVELNATIRSYTKDTTRKD